MPKRPSGSDKHQIPSTEIQKMTKIQMTKFQEESFGNESLVIGYCLEFGIW